MGIGSGSRVVQGTIAAAAAVLASASATVDVPEKMHLKVTPILFHAVPVSMPLPPLASLSGACGCGASAMAPPRSVSFPGVSTGTKEWISGRPTPPPPTGGWLPPPPPSGCAPGYPSSDFSLAQGTVGGSLLSSSSSRRVLGHMLPVFLATSVAPASSQVSAMMFHSGVAYPAAGTTTVRFPTLAPFCFSTSGLYSAPVTQKHMGLNSWRTPGHDEVTSLPYYSVLHAQAETPVTLANLGAHIAQTPHASIYLESLLGRLLSFQSSNFPYSPSPQATQSLHTWHAPNTGVPRGLKDGGDKDALEKQPVLTVVLLGWLGAQQKHLKKYADWYNARGIHAVTFVIPMADLLSLKGHGNAEEHVDSLTRHLAQYISEKSDSEGENQLIFHTFSNTGWLTDGSLFWKSIVDGASSHADMELFWRRCRSKETS